MLVKKKKEHRQGHDTHLETIHVNVSGLTLISHVNIIQTQSRNVCTYKVFINQSSLLPSCWNPIKQRMDRVKCWYVNLCKWRALLRLQSHWMVTAIFSTAVATGRKPQCRCSLPPQVKPSDGGLHCSVRSSPNSLTKSLYLKLGIVLNVRTIRPWLNQLWQSKLNRRIIIELMIKILMWFYTLFLFDTLVEV